MGFYNLKFGKVEYFSPEAFLGPYQTSTLEPFWENSKRLTAVKESDPSKIFNRVLNMFLLQSIISDFIEICHGISFIRQNIIDISEKSLEISKVDHCWKTSMFYRKYQT